MSDRDLVEGYSCWIRKQVREVYTFLSSKKTSIEAFSWMSDRDLAEGYSCWIRKQVTRSLYFLVYEIIALIKENPQ